MLLCVKETPVQKRGRERVEREERGREGEGGWISMQVCIGGDETTTVKACDI